MFDFIFMQPKPIARFELPDVFGRQGLIVDTCGGMTDSEHEYETGIAHPSYNDGKWVIVEDYDTEEDAKKGHDKWVKIMTADSLPSVLNDVSTAVIAKLGDEFIGNSFRCNPYTIDITPEEQNELPESTK
jgi:hypothetical protein